MLQNVKPEDVRIGLACRDWEDAIRQSAQTLLAHEAIEEGYVDAMIDVIRRNGPCIVITKGVALAHARPDCGVAEKGLTFSLLSPPVSFGAGPLDPIQLIITLAATDSESHLDVMAELAGILIDEERLAALLTAPSPEAFCAELQK